MAHINNGLTKQNGFAPFQGYKVKVTSKFGLVYYGYLVPDSKAESDIGWDYFRPYWLKVIKFDTYDNAYKYYFPVLIYASDKIELA